MISDAVALSRVVDAFRRLQDLARRKIEPDSIMTDHDFVDSALGEIDNDRINAALEIVELIAEDAASDEK